MSKRKSFRLRLWRRIDRYRSVFRKKTLQTEKEKYKYAIYSFHEENVNNHHSKSLLPLHFSVPEKARNDRMTNRDSRRAQERVTIGMFLRPGNDSSSMSETTKASRNWSGENGEELEGEEKRSKSWKPWELIKLNCLLRRFWDLLSLNSKQRRNIKTTKTLSRCVYVQGKNDEDNNNNNDNNKVRNSQTHAFEGVVGFDSAPKTRREPAPYVYDEDSPFVKARSSNTNRSREMDEDSAPAPGNGDEDRDLRKQR